jgi:ATP/maltotriose-dependent transcriptional regulator MalT
MLALVGGNRLSRGWIVCLLAHLTAMRGDFDSARQLYRDGSAAIREVAGEAWHLAWTSLSSSRVEMLAGDFAEAERLLRRAADILEGMGEQYLLATVAALLGRSAAAQERYEDALELSTRAELLAGADDIETQAEWRALRADVLACTGGIDDAKVLAQDALQLLLPTDSAVMKVDALLDLARVFARVNDERAKWAANEALVVSERKGNLVAAAAAEELLGRLGVQPALQAD